MLKEIRLFYLGPQDASALEGLGPLAPGMQVTPALLNEQIRNIQKKAAELGIEYSEVVTAPVLVPDEGVVLHVLIEPKSPIKVWDFDVKGGGWIMGSRLEKRFDYREQTVLKRPKPFFGRGTLLTAERAAKAINETGLYYRRAGYLEAWVVMDKLEIVRDEEYADLIFEVNRGGQYKIEDLAVIETEKLSPEAYMERIEQYEGKDFSQKHYEEIEAKILKLAQQHGYMASHVEKHHGLNPDKKEVGILIKIQEGDKSTLNTIKLNHKPLPDPPEEPNWFQRNYRKFAPFMEDETILQFVRTEPGDELDYRDTAGLERRLQRLGMFGKVQVETRATSDTTRRDLYIEVEDRRSGNTNFSGGWADSSGITGMIQIGESNVMGTGDRLSVSLMGSENRQSINISYLNRDWPLGNEWTRSIDDKWLGEKSYSALKTSFFLRQGKYDDDLYTEQEVGAALEWIRDWEGKPRRSPFDYVPRPLPDVYTLWRDRIRVSLSQVEYDTEEDPNDYATSFDSYFTALASYDIEYDSRPRGDFSTHGSYFNFKMEGGYADGGLFKTQVDYRKHFPLGEKLSYTAFGSYGTMPTDISDVGLSERLHLGGGSDMRLFVPRGMGPVDKREEDLHTGGASRALLQNELRYELVRNFMLLSFLDVGTLDRSAFSMTDPRASAGVGARYRMGELGGIYFYTGYILDSAETDRETAFHFGFRLDL
ncbi:MAG: outer membrane protein assembly factor [Candidatus Sumerlaeia bacterium]